MKKTLTLLAAASMLCACAQAVTLKSGEEHTFDKWTLNQEGSAKTYDVEVPSTVAGVLCDKGVFGENLLDSDNYFSVDKSIFDTPWVYKTDFKLNKVALSCRLSWVSESVFPGWDESLWSTSYSKVCRYRP